LVIGSSGYLVIWIDFTPVALAQSVIDRMHERPERAAETADDVCRGHCFEDDQPHGERRGGRSCRQAAGEKRHVRRRELSRVCNARSRAEFIAKLGLVVEEVDETLYWLELMSRSMPPPAGLGAVLEDALEVRAIFAKSLGTARSHLRASRPK
jgi:hypothetical protein